MGNCCFGSKKPIHEPIERHDADDELKQQVEAKHESDRHQQKVWITFQGPFVVNNSSQFIIKVKDPSRTSPEFELHQGCSFRIPEDAEVEIEIPREAMLGKIWTADLSQLYKMKTLFVKNFNLSLSQLSFGLLWNKCFPFKLLQLSHSKDSCSAGHYKKGSEHLPGVCVIKVYRPFSTCSCRARLRSERFALLMFL